MFYVLLLLLTLATPAQAFFQAVVGPNGTCNDQALGDQASVKPFQIDVLNGTLAIADNGNNQVRGRNISGLMHLYTPASLPVGVALASDGTVIYSSDLGLLFFYDTDIHPLPTTGIVAARGLALGGGFLYVADQRQSGLDGRVWRLPMPCSGCVPELVIDNGTVRNPQGVALGPDGTLYVTDTTGNRVVARSPAGAISVVAGTGVQGYGGDGGPAASALLDRPAAVDVTPNGRLFICDKFNNRVRMVQDGTITTVIGSGALPTSAAPPPAGSNPLAFAFRCEGVAWDQFNGLLFASSFTNQQIVARDFGAIPTPPTATVTRTVPVATATTTATPIPTATATKTCPPGCGT